MSREDIEAFHQIQHFEVGERVVIRHLSEMHITKEGAPSLGSSPSFFSPSSGGYSLLFNGSMQALSGESYVIHKIRSRTHGYLYKLSLPHSERPIPFLYSAYMLRRSPVTNQNSTFLLSSEKEERL